jgi:hypothetical protein
MADTGGLDLDEYFALLGAGEIDCFYDERRTSLVRNGSTDLHTGIPL